MSAGARGAAAASAPAGAPGRAGRHRDPAADQAILDATLALLEEVGYGGLTMAAVIERAGVSSATLYRRWPAKHDLVAAAIASLSPPELVVDKGSLARDLLAFTKALGHGAAARGTVFGQLAADVHLHPELTASLREKLVEPRLDALAGILERAVARGELRSHPPVDVVFSLIAGPVHHHTAGLGQPATPAFLRTVAVHVLHGLQGPDLAPA
jgi:AcrR family transcriptional regulator